MKLSELLVQLGAKFVDNDYNFKDYNVIVQAWDGKELEFDIKEVEFFHNDKVVVIVAV